MCNTFRNRIQLAAGFLLNIVARARGLCAKIAVQALGRFTLPPPSQPVPTLGAISKSMRAVGVFVFRL